MTKLSKQCPGHSTTFFLSLNSCAHSRCRQGIQGSWSTGLLEHTLHLGIWLHSKDACCNSHRLGYLLIRQDLWIEPAAALDAPHLFLQQANPLMSERENQIRSLE